MYCLVVMVVFARTSEMPISCAAESSVRVVMLSCWPEVTRNMDVAAQRVERDVAAKLRAQFALHGVARLEYALGEHAALVGRR